MSQVTITKVVEGATRLIIRADLVSNGGEGELTNYVLVSPADLSPPQKANDAAFSIQQIWYSFVWFDANLQFGGIPGPRQAWPLPRQTGNHIDFRSFGGICDVQTAPPSDFNGQILISTNGFAPLGNVGAIVLELRKLNA